MFADIMLRHDTTVAKCETLISYPFVRMTSKRTFEDFACQCAHDIGGTPDEWMRKNKKLVGIFGTKKKMLAKNTRFQVPSKLVEHASDRFFETVGLKSKMPSPVSVVVDDISPDTSYESSSPVSR